MTILLQGNGQKTGQTNKYQCSERIVIPTGAQRSGGTCCFSSGSHADCKGIPLRASQVRVFKVGVVALLCLPDPGQSNQLIEFFKFDHLVMERRRSASAE